MRQSVRKFDSKSVQGQGTWVCARKMTVGEIAEADARIEVEGNFEYSMSILREKVLEWNWTDDEDQPLPQPKDDAGVLDDLTDEEFNFLCECVVGKQPELKN